MTAGPGPSGPPDRPDPSGPDIRFVVYGAGAIGGVIAAALHASGQRVVVTARGDHLRALRADGLRMESPEGPTVASVPAFERAGEIGLAEGDVVLLAVKSQDTVGALVDLAGVAPDGVAVVCLQNGVFNEVEALRRFPDVYGAVVMVPATHLAPGVVVSHAAPCRGAVDVGRYPEGTDARSEAIAAALGRAGFDARSVPDIQRWKYVKLLRNVVNAIDAVFGLEARGGVLHERAIAEGSACLAAAGIDHASPEEEAERRRGLQPWAPVEGFERPGSSAWQSLARGTGALETDYLNGEIVLLGRLHGVPTPVNALVQRWASQLAARGEPPGSRSMAAALRELGLAEGGAPT